MATNPWSSSFVQGLSPWFFLCRKLCQSSRPPEKGRAELELAHVTIHQQRRQQHQTDEENRPQGAGARQIVSWRGGCWAMSCTHAVAADWRQPKP